jgi:FkbM family methyltransferase
MTLLTRVRENLNDVRHLGPGFLMRHVAKLRRLPYSTVPIPHVGPVHIRPCESDAATLRQVFTEQQYDLGAGSPVLARAQRRYEDILAAGDVPVVVDAGANVGAASLWFRLAWPEATVVAVEPEKGNATVLRKNLDGKPGFVVMEAAIGARHGAVAIENAETGWGARTVRAETGIPMVTMQDAVAEVPRGRLFIAKIDIEGFEQDLFSENTEWLAQAFIVLVEPHDWMFPGRHTSRSFQRAMAEHDFELFISGENLIYVRVE